MTVALRKESVDRNWSAYPRKTGKAESLSARRAWIEIYPAAAMPTDTPMVALRKESVDRNEGREAASRAELESLSARRAWIEIGMDDVIKHPKQVALRKESVDRNKSHFDIVHLHFPSLSARRAWIEIKAQQHHISVVQSLSARRAWIEIHERTHSFPHAPVALRKESVDRNRPVRAVPGAVPGRSPQGERG